MTAAQLSHATNLSESAVSRTLNGRTVPAFDSIAEAAHTLGYELRLTPLERTLVKVTGLSMRDLVETIRLHSGEADQWNHISIALRNLLEFPDKHPSDFNAVTKDMDRNWTAFMAGLYDYQHWGKGPSADASQLRLAEPWTPLRKIYRSASAPAPEFARYNVILPQGELQWK